VVVPVGDEVNLGNSHTSAIGNLAPSLTNVIIFGKIYTYIYITKVYGNIYITKNNYNG
jgi:hypothetical protein